MERFRVLERSESIMKSDRIICPLGHPVASEFFIPFQGDRVVISIRVEIFAATDFVLVEAAGFWAATLEEPAEVGFDSELQLSILEIELTDLFTEVCESI